MTEPTKEPSPAVKKDFTWEERTPTPGFGEVVTPNTERPTTVLATVHMQSTSGSTAQVDVEVDQGGGWTLAAPLSVTATAGALTSPPDVSAQEAVKIDVPPGGDYRIVNNADPAGGNSVVKVLEATR